MIEPLFNVTVEHSRSRHHAHPRMGSLLALCAILAFAPPRSMGQRVDQSGFVFDDSSVPVIEITLSDADFATLFAAGNQYSDEELPAGFRFTRDGVSATLDSIGFRLRGNTSRDAAKKSFKVSFNSFLKGGEFYDLEKLNLNGEHNDPTIMRAKASWDMFNQAGLPASRANHVDLYINGNYYGVYLNVEHVDEKFLDRRFGNTGGNLYKCLWPADLSYLGADAAAYRPTDPSRRPYDLKLKDDDLEGYDDLARFITVLNTSNDARFADEIEKVFDVNGFLRAQALTVLLGSWDSYWFLMNNYYLYHDPDTGLFEYIPFDFDNVMGIWWDGIYPGLDWTDRDVYQWGHPGEARPLMERLLAEPKFRDRYTFYVKKLLRDVFDRGNVASSIFALRDSLYSRAVADPFRPLDYGFSAEDFVDNYTDPLSNQAHVVDGILSFVEARSRSASSQLEPGDISPIISDLSFAPDRARPSSEVLVTVRVEDEQLDRVELHYWLGMPLENVVEMLPSPNRGRDVFVASIVAQSTDGFIDFRVEAEDHIGQRSVTRLRTLEVGQAVPLFVNELMASNQSTITDPANELDDWIELYNGGEVDLSLAGLYMTDTLGIPLKWAMPDTSLPAGGHLLIWADEDGMQGPLHANFKLSRSGEVVAIFDDRGALIDSVSFGVQVADVSYGRLPDGGPSFVSFSSPSPGLPNGMNVRVVPENPSVGDLLVNIFPNPSRGRVTLSFSTPLDNVRVDVFDVLGRRIATMVNDGVHVTAVHWDGESGVGAPLPAGVYLLRVSGTQRDAMEVRRSIPLIRLRQP